MPEVLHSVAMAANKCTVYIAEFQPPNYF